MHCTLESVLEQIPGVGPITALYFVLKIEDPARFEKCARHRSLRGLCPRRDQSRESDPRDQFVVPLVKFLPRRRFAFHISLHHCVTSFNNVIEIVVNRDIRIFSPSL
jgi:hypothetical protein